MRGITEALASFPAQTAMVHRFPLLTFDPNPRLYEECRYSIHTIVNCLSKGQKWMVSADYMC